MCAVISIITAAFIPFIIISILIIIHELGHFLAAISFKIEVDKIYLYPLGGVSKFHLPQNYPTLKELIILISGPLFQELAKTILLILMPRYTQEINIYHYGILLFNLLPIYPLDGGKIVQLILQLFIPYKQSLKINIKISYIFIFIYFIFILPTAKITAIIVTFFLLYKVREEEKKISFLYEKFILERYINNYKFKHSELITNQDSFYKNKRHLIKINDNYYLEKDFLEKKYKKI